ncbi:hypothetical protein [Yinghuangia sp. YIM S09857]|uniref:hypothetical protein n=1 Tax=Yinghuangia sp. YIM S09857 TaxID=3436929 RepID=UPI003F52CC96
MRRVIAAALSAAGLLVASSTPVAAESDGKVATISDARVTESSGLAASLRHPGVVWTHNDSGGKPQLFAIGPNGAVKATITLAGAKAEDWEALALGTDESGRPALYVGDIGDNKAQRTDAAIYRVPEPEVLRDAELTPVRYRIAYQDGPRDAEALLIHPSTNRVLVVSKSLIGAGIYTSAGPLRADAANTLTRTAKAPAMVTDGAYSPDGSRFILRSYLSSDMYSAPGRRVGGVDSPVQPQGESVTFRPDGAAVLFGSEGADSVIWRVVLRGANLPDSVRAPVAAPRPQPAAPPPPSPSPTTAPEVPTTPASPPPATSEPPAPPSADAAAPVAADVSDGDTWFDAANPWLWLCLALAGLLGTGAVRLRRAARNG